MVLDNVQICLYTWKVFTKTTFLDAQASLAPTHVCLSVRWLVGHTFEFPYYQSLWLLYVKS